MRLQEDEQLERWNVVELLIENIHSIRMGTL